MVSAGSSSAAILYPVCVLFGIQSGYYLVSGNYFIFSVIVALIVVFNHRQNIKRILSGNENKLSFKH